ncbi:hypothetical protein F4810DRAFT_711956 [Camillea tinctor]|nr:hypothetical protein F4810DRAFT_711956 [Camillea tinctor]
MPVWLMLTGDPRLLAVKVIVLDCGLEDALIELLYAARLERGVGSNHRPSQGPGGAQRLGPPGSSLPLQPPRIRLRQRKIVSSPDRIVPGGFSGDMSFAAPMGARPLPEVAISRIYRDPYVGLTFRNRPGFKVCWHHKDSHYFLTGIASSEIIIYPVLPLSGLLPDWKSVLERGSGLQESMILQSHLEWLPVGTWRMVEYLSHGSSHPRLRNPGRSDGPFYPPIQVRIMSKTAPKKGMTTTKSRSEGRCSGQSRMAMKLRSKTACLELPLNLYEARHALSAPILTPSGRVPRAKIDVEKDKVRLAWER